MNVFNFGGIFFQSKKKKKAIKDKLLTQKQAQQQEQEPVKEDKAVDYRELSLLKSDSFDTTTTVDDARLSNLNDRNITRLDSMFGSPPQHKISKNLHDLLENNKYWAAQKVRGDPLFFQRLSSAQQQPNYLWIGCSDSRVPANQIVNMPPGELFVHRNVANLVCDDDKNALAVIQYAVENLKVKHIIVCGHTFCGGVRACLGPKCSAPLENWLSPLRDLKEQNQAHLESLPDEDARWRFLCEENVRQQIAVLEKLPIIRNAWENKQAIALHGWLYSMNEGLLRDLAVTYDNGYYPEQLPFREASCETRDQYMDQSVDPTMIPSCSPGASEVPERI
jgi:carbonic anhydrase